MIMPPPRPGRQRRPAEAARPRRRGRPRRSAKLTAAAPIRPSAPSRPRDAPAGRAHRADPAPVESAARPAAARPPSGPPALPAPPARPVSISATRAQAPILTPRRPRLRRPFGLAGAMACGERLSDLPAPARPPPSGEQFAIRPDPASRAGAPVRDPHRPGGRPTPNRPRRGQLPVRHARPRRLRQALKPRCRTSVQRRRQAVSRTRGEPNRPMPPTIQPWRRRRHGDGCVTGLGRRART